MLFPMKSNRNLHNIQVTLMQRILRQVLNGCAIGSFLSLVFATTAWADYGGFATDNQGQPYASVQQATASSAREVAMTHCRNTTKAGGCRYLGSFQNSYLVVVVTQAHWTYYPGAGQSEADAYSFAQSQCRPNNIALTPNGFPMAFGDCRFGFTLHSNESSILRIGQ